MTTEPSRIAREAAARLADSEGTPDDVLQIIQSAIDASLPQWLPIESAPDKGQFIVALRMEEGWFFQTASKTAEGHIQSVDDCEPYFCRPYQCDPTHWQPLPPAPQGRAG